MKRYSLHIGIDLDGVCYDFAKSLSEYLVESEGFDPDSLPEPTCWEFYEKDWGLTLDEFLTLFAKGVDAGYVFRVGDPHDDCVEIMRTLHLDHSLHIVTHRTIGERGVQNTMEWLFEKQIPYDTITFSRDKTIVKTDLFIEDNVDNFLALEEAGVQAVLMDRPWNQHLDTPYRVEDWCAFYEYVEEYTWRLR